MVPKFVPADSLRSSCLPDMPSTLSSSGADPFHALVAQYEANDYTPTTEPYLSAIASALYATCMTRPDAAYAVAMLCRVTSRPSKEAWLALVKVLCYLYKTRKHGITYGGDARYDDRLSNNCETPSEPQAACLPAWTHNLLRCLLEDKFLVVVL